MIRRTLGCSGIEVPAVAIGTWAIGGTWWGGTEEAASMAAIRAALDGGIDFIDTAPVYGFGRSEEIVGRAIAGRDRDIAILAYSPLALGLLTGTTQPGREYGPGDQRRTHRRFTPDNIAKVNALLARFEPLRRSCGLTMTQLAIAWTISRPGVTTALVGVRTVEQAREMAGGGVELSPVDLASMDAMIAEAGLQA